MIIITLYYRWPKVTSECWLNSAKTKKMLKWYKSYLYTRLHRQNTQRDRCIPFLLGIHHVLHNCSQLEYIVKWFLIPIIFEPPSVKQIGSKIIVLDWWKEGRFGSNYRKFRKNPMWCISVFREKLSEKKCTRQSRKVIWDIINKLFLTFLTVGTLR